MNETIVMPDVGEAAPEGRKPWARPVLQRLGAKDAQCMSPGGSSDSHVVTGDMDPSCS
jgi:hypothetical protein